MSIDKTAIPQGTTAERLRGVASDETRERIATLATRYWERASYVLLMAIAASMRFFQLGERGLHHDESLHAYYSYNFAQALRQVFTFGTANDATWKHVPFMHGPFQFIGNGFVMWIFGDGDFQSRILAATLGTALVGMPFLLRKQLGTAGALFAAVFIAFSPTLLYYSRFTREDIYTAFWTFGLAIFIWRYLDTKQDRYIFLSSGFMSGLFLTKEVSYFFVIAFLGFLSYLVALELGEKIREQHPDNHPVLNWLIFAVLTLASPLILILWPLIKEQRERYKIDTMPVAGSLLVCLGSIAIVQYAAFIQMVMGNTWKLRNGGADSYIASQERTVAFTSIFLLMAASLVIGLTWNVRTWLIAAATFWVPYVLLSTTFLTNLPGFWSVLWGSLDYWISQQDVARGDQPPFYYFMTVPIYEFLPLALSIVAMFYYMIRSDRTRAMIVSGAVIVIAACLLLPTGPIIFGRETAQGKEGASLLHVYIPFGIAILLTLSLKMDHFTRFLIFWVLAVSFALTIASEKMPWLNVHIALALAVLAGKFVGDIVTRSDLREDLPSLERFAPFLYAATAAALCILVFTLVGPFAPASFGAWALAGVAAVSVYWAFSGYSRRTAIQVATIGAVAAFGVFTIRAAVLASYGHPDSPFVGQPGDVAQRDYGEVPDELLVYTATSGDIPVLRDRIAALGRETGKGKDIPIVVDATDGYSWPWAWYLRGYHNVQYPIIDDGFTPPEGAVVLASANNKDKVKLPPGAYQPGVTYHHRRWFQENYRGKFKCDDNGDCTQSYGTYDFLSDLTSWHQLKFWTSFWVRRLPTPAGQPGTTDGVAFFPLGTGTIDLGPDGPTAHTEGFQTVIGSKGYKYGQFDGPSDVAMDSSGNIYVADTNNNRIQKFDSTGKYVASVGGFGSDITMNQPWALTVDGEGNVYVADTWDHKILEFDSDLNLINQWGEGAQTAAGGDPFGLFGPRDITLTNTGNVLITDTGNHRLVEYTPDGEFVRQFGQQRTAQTGEGPTNFFEPVSVVVNSAGDIYVADYENKRIVVLTSDLQQKTIIPVPDWGSRQVTDRAYLALLPDGRVLATVPNPCPNAPAGPDQPDVVCNATSGNILTFSADGRQLASYPLPKEGAEGVARPIGIATDGQSVIVADSQSSVVRKIALSEVAP